MSNDKFSKTANDREAEENNLSYLLDGSKYKSIADHIIALRVTGVYVEPRSEQVASEMIITAQKEINAAISLEENYIQTIKDLLGKRLLRDAYRLANLRGESIDTYVREFEDIIEGYDPDNMRYLDKCQPLYGLILKSEWCAEPLIDPVRLEFYFDSIFRNKFTSDEADVFKKSFANYWSSEYPEIYDEELRDRDHHQALHNWDYFHSSLFDIDSQCGKSAANKFRKLMMDSIYSPFSEYCSLEISSDNCYFDSYENLFYAAIAGLRSNGKIDICIFDGNN